MLNWLRRIFRKKSLSTEHTVHNEEPQQAGRESDFVLDPDDETLERINQKLQDGVYRPVTEEDID